MISYKNIEVFITAGGKSSRMGQDKGLLMLGNLPMIAYAINACAELNLSTTIITNNNAYQHLNIPVVKDRIPDKGPMSALHTSLSNTKKEFILLLSCDMPFITSQAIQKLGKGDDTKEVIVASSANEWNPLFSLYSKKLASKITASIMANELKMKSFIATCSHQIITFDDMLTQNPLLFCNINTPLEFETLSKQWPQQLK